MRSEIVQKELADRNCAVLPCAVLWLATSATFEKPSTQRQACKIITPEPVLSQVGREALTGLADLSVKSCLALLPICLSTGFFRQYHLR